MVPPSNFPFLPSFLLLHLEILHTVYLYALVFVKVDEFAEEQRGTAADASAEGLFGGFSLSKAVRSALKFILLHYSEYFLRERRICCPPLSP